MTVPRIEEAFYSILANDATVSDAVNGIYLYVAPQTVSGPIIIIQVEEVDPHTTLSRNDPTSALSTVEITGYSGDQGALLSLRQAVRDALHGCHGDYTIGGGDIFLYSVLADESRFGRIESTDDDDLGALMFQMSFTATHSL